MAKKTHLNATFITGATGFIAFELIKNILKNEPSGPIYVLIRANSKYTAVQRFNQLLEELARQDLSKQVKELEHRIHLVEGDITLTDLGMNPGDYQNLATNVNRIYHVAASVHLTGSLDKMLSTNVNGTRALLEFALLSQHSGDFDMFNYVSTAYVAGNRSGIVYENELIKEQKFNNNYERAKYEAEIVVRSYDKKLPIVIYRPSIVMGHSITGWTKTFNVLYEPMKMVYFGLLKFAPANHNSILDIVPVDYVAKGIYHISTQKQKATSNTFHLTIGKGKSTNFPIIIKKITSALFRWAEIYNVTNPQKEPILVNPGIFSYFAKIIHVLGNDRQKRKINKMLTYTDYVAINKEFDASNAQAILEPQGIICPRVEDYLDSLCHYAVKTHFGKSDKPEHVYNKPLKNKEVSELKNILSNS